MKKWLSLVLVTCLMLPLMGGCSKNYPDGKELLAQSQKKMAKAESMSLDMAMDLDVTISMGKDASLAMKMKLNGNGDVNSKGEGHLNMDMDISALGNNQKTETEVYNVLENDSLVSYTKADDAWVKSTAIEASQMDMFTSLTEQENMEILKKAKLEVVDTKKINKKDTYQLQITLDAESFEKISSSLGDVGSDLTGTGMDIASMIEVLGDDFELTYDFYIDQETKEILRMSMDLKPIFKKALKKAMELSGQEVDVEIKKCDVFIDFGDFNKDIKFTVPEDIKAIAVNMDEEDATTDEDMQTEEGDISTQTHTWETMELLYDNQVAFKLNETKVQKLIDLGFTTDEKLTSKISKDDPAYMIFTKDDKMLSLSAINNSNKKIQLKDAVADYLSIDGDFKLIGNIGVGNTLDEAIQAYGQANTKSIYEGMITLDYSSADGNKSLSITSYDGVTIDSITISDYSNY